MNEAFTAAKQTFCKSCLEQFLAEHRDLTRKPGAIARLRDPSMCAECGADGGDAELGTIAGLPVCATCDNRFRNRPFPTWLKASLAVLMCVAVAAFVYNLRFFLAYVELIRGGRAVEKGDVVQAAAMYESAAGRVPEIKELAVMSSLFKAQRLLANDKDEEALALIQSVSKTAPHELQATYHELELIAESGVAFKRHDYDTFLDRSQKMMELRPSLSRAVAGVASAYACKYAATGERAFYEESLKYLARARELESGGSKEAQEYESRIRHRLQTRNVITKEEFDKKFPNGWKPEVGR